MSFEFIRKLPTPTEVKNEVTNTNTVKPENTTKPQNNTTGGKDNSAGDGKDTTTE